MQFGGKKPLDGKPAVIYGAGTGLGVAHLIHADKRWLSLPGEGGHVDFAPNSEEEDIILEQLRTEMGHVSAERILSGPGLVNLYRAIVKSDNRVPENFKPKDVTELALSDENCRLPPRAVAVLRDHGAVWRQSGAEHGHIWRGLYCGWHRAALPGILQSVRFSCGV